MAYIEPYACQKVAVMRSIRRTSVFCDDFDKFYISHLRQQASCTLPRLCFIWPFLRQRRDG